MATERPPKSEQDTTKTNPFQFDDGQPGTQPKKERRDPDPGKAAGQGPKAEDPEEEVAHPKMPQP